VDPSAAAALKGVIGDMSTLPREENALVNLLTSEGVEGRPFTLNDRAAAEGAPVKGVLSADVPRWQR
jgi:hypothetical protein